MKKILSAAVAVLALGACKSNTPTTTPAATPATGTGATTVATPAAGTGATTTAAVSAAKSTLTATVAFTGTAPAPKKLNKEADPFCAKTPGTDEEVLVKDGKLANVMVRVTKGAEGKFEAPATAAEIDQTGCMYRPRVLGVVAGQDVKIKSNDDTTHNVHTYKGEESIFNRAQNKGEFVKKTSDFKTDNGAITFKCDIHPWMTGYVIVNPNPYFAVTDVAGLAKLDLPAGKYTVEAWHEKFGTKTAEVTVEAGKPAEVKFEYAGTEKPAM